MNKTPKDTVAHRDTCAWCGVPWTEHLGIVGTCASLQHANAEIKKLRQKIRMLEKRNEVAYLSWRKARRLAVK